MNLVVNRTWSLCMLYIYTVVLSISYTLRLYVTAVIIAEYQVHPLKEIYFRERGGGGGGGGISVATPFFNSYTP